MNEEFQLYKSCFGCEAPLLISELERNHFVCHLCQYHFLIGHAERIAQLADERSFEGLFENVEPIDSLGFISDLPYSAKLIAAQRKTEMKDAIVTGTCKIIGRSVALGVLDFAFFGGSVGSVVGEKITRLAEHALSHKLPLVLVISSGGARMQEGIFSLMQLAKTSGAIDQLRERRILYISVLTEPTFGGALASFGMQGDFVIAEPGARFGFAGKKVVELTSKTTAPEGFQTAEFNLKHGHIDMIVQHSKLVSTLGRLIEMHKPVPVCS